HSAHISLIGRSHRSPHLRRVSRLLSAVNAEESLVRLCSRFITAGRTGKTQHDPDDRRLHSHQRSPLVDLAALHSARSRSATSAASHSLRTSIPADTAHHTCRTVHF